MRYMYTNGVNATTPFLEYNDAGHDYYVDGERYPSVTQILESAGLVSPYCKDVEAAWRGSEVHRYCAMDDADGINLLQVYKEWRGYIKAWRQWKKDVAFVPTLIETRVDQLQYKYSGRLDRVGHRNGRTLTTLLDIKTSGTGAVADYVRYQLVAYAFALRPNHVFERMAVALRPDGRYNVKTFSMTDFNQDLARFLEMARNCQG